ncbi:MAG: ESX-1 secretion-associated protein [Actinophytocola sp.]|uniref:type VII secretion target n=1 Tax=Actinophytocola sp. TaxID=1872138 RepID=UPI0013246A42|nr:type VII secretion target [Actinophytocola sp.]MPZ86246.1 ESX-1 secretion-associated protein [Actinophytocola sp.]
MGEGFAVNPDEVNSHAGTVDGFAGRADTAVDAGAHVTGLDDAYGLFCRPFGEMLKDPQQRGVDTLTETATFMHETVTDLRDSAEHYQQVEDQVRAAIEALLEMLERIAEIPMVRGGN